jgi:PLD-like domain
MLAPDSRTLLIDQLTPPLGHRLDAAIATTFTLDLTATLLPALAFTGFHLSSGLSDPIATLESVRSTANRIDVYCQAGDIGVPDQAPDLLAFLEPMIQPVRAPRRGLFHPKLWFIRFVHDETGATAHRLLVLSRNLTMDASWDLAIRLDADHLADSVRPESAALGDLLRSLPDRTVRPRDEARRQRALDLAGEADRIVWERPPHADEVLLHFLDEGRPLTMDLRGSRHLVVSPFVDRGGLDHVSKGPIEILSRAEELDKLDDDTVARLSDARVLDELAVAQEVESSRLGGQLHAKMYVVEQTTRWRQSHVFIGSANATGAGFSLNTEFMVELRGHKNKLGVGRFLGDDGDFLAMTEPYGRSAVVEEDPDDTFRRELENAVRRVASLAYTVEVIGESDGPERAYDLRLRSDRALSLSEGWTASVKLLTASDYSALIGPETTLDAIVPDVDTGDITPFLAVRVENQIGMRVSTVVAAELVNAPDDRLDVVLARQIDTPEKFLRFLFFLLSLGGHQLASGGSGGGGAGRGGNPFGAGGSGVLEMVLGALASRPEALADLDALIRRMEATEDGLSSLPEGFADFWAVVRVAAGFATMEATVESA